MNPLLATYIHHIDPVLLNIPGTPLALRWYGLAYVAGFVLGYYALLLLSKRNLYCVAPDKLGDFITTVCIFGVLMGGRLGEFFFYWLPEHGLSGLAEDPAWVLRVWEGGMASHGGIIAVVLVALWYALRRGHSFCAVLDGLAIVSPIGICFGRIANFINGELYGRIVPEGSSLGVKFPLEFSSLPADVQIRALTEMEHAAGAPLLTLQQPGEYYYDMLLRLCRENDAVREAMGAVLNERYPSQLFEALGEGALIFAVLLAVRLLWRNAPAGIFSALFALLYAAARITCEGFKQPDAGVWYGITQGQWLSIGIALMGVGFLIAAVRNYRNANAA